MNVIIEIEELVLYGFPAGDRHAIAEVLAAELARLVDERGLPSGAVLPAGVAWNADALTGHFMAPPAARREAVGTAVALAVYQTLAAALLQEA